MKECKAGVRDLQNAVGLCAMATKARSPSDVARSIHFGESDADGFLGVRGTNFVISIGTAIPVEGPIFTGGVSADLLVAAVNGLDGDTVTLREDGNKLTIHGKKRVFGLPISVMPLAPDPNPKDDWDVIAVDGNQLADAIDGVEFVAGGSPDSASATWKQAVYFGADDAGIDVTSADGNRVATQWIAAVCKANKDRMLGRDHAGVFSKIARGDSATLSMGDSVAIVSCGPRWASAPFVEGSPPPWRKMMKDETSAKVATFDRKFLLAEAKAVSAMMSSENGNDSLTIHISKDGYTLIGGRTIAVARGGGLPITADDFTLVVNHRYFVDAIANGTGDVTRIAFFDKFSPIQFDGESSHRQLVMSMNVDPQPL